MPPSSEIVEPTSKMGTQGALGAAEQYTRRGYRVVPVPRGEKRPVIRGWQDLRLDESQLAAHFTNATNVGILTGQPSGGLIDIDLDAAEAIATADYFLPPTDLEHGRPSKQRSHRWYRVSERLHYLKLSDPRREENATLVELRQDKHQTLVPPSETNGEIRTWDKDGDPGRVDGTALRCAVARVAAAALLVRYWPKSGRHDARMALTGGLARAGWVEEDVVTFVQAVVQQAQPGDREAHAKVRGDTRAAFVKSHRKEPLTGLPRLAELVGSDVIGCVKHWLGLDNSDGDTGHEKVGRGESCATTLVKLARTDADFFHDGDVCYAEIQTGGHRETHVLKSTTFRRWLGRVYFETCGRTASGEAMTSAMLALEGHACFDCPGRRVFTRTAHHAGKIYLDLCDADWRVIEIGHQGWHIIESKDSPVRFRRAPGMLPLPGPERGGNLSELRALLNCPGDILLLLVGWLIGTLHPYGPYPVLILHGEQGSAKSTTARGLRSLIDPNLAPGRSQPREPRDLMIAATNGWVCAFDNLSSLPEWFSDALCRLSTGGGFSTRALYTDDEERIFEAKRPVMLNGIEELATRGDLLDRALVVELPRITDEQRQPEDSLRTAFESARPRLLGALLDATRSAFSLFESTKLKRLPRMADFVIWVTAAEEALGWRLGSFERVYRENQRAANDLTLEEPIADALLKLDLPWKGTATELLTTLEKLAGERTCGLKVWPKIPKALSNTLRRLAPNLRWSGIEVRFVRSGGKRYIELETSRNPAAPQAQASSSCPDSASSAESADKFPVLEGEF